MDPNAERIVWTEGPGRPDSVSTPWRPFAGSAAALRHAITRDRRAAARQRVAARIRVYTASLRRPPRRGRRAAEVAAAMTLSAALLLLVPSTLFPMWLKLTGAVVLAASSWAEVLPDRLERAAPALRIVARVLLVPFFVGLFVAVIIA